MKRTVTCIVYINKDNMDEPVDCIVTWSFVTNAYSIFFNESGNPSFICRAVQPVVQCMFEFMETTVSKQIRLETHDLNQDDFAIINSYFNEHPYIKCKHLGVQSPRISLGSLPWSLCRFSFPIKILMVDVEDVWSASAFNCCELYVNCLTELDSIFNYPGFNGSPMTDDQILEKLEKHGSVMHCVVNYHNLLWRNLSCQNMLKNKSTYYNTLEKLCMRAVSKYNLDVSICCEDIKDTYKKFWVI